MTEQAVLRVALGGFGVIGRHVAAALDQGIDGLRLVAVSARDGERARQRMAAFKVPVPVLPLAELAAVADVVVECAPASCFLEVAAAAIEAGRVFMPLSVGQLLDHMDLIERARETGARIHVPTGALLGLDAVRAAAEGELRSVTMVTRKPPKGLTGAPHLIANNIDLSGLRAPLKVFDGSARDAIRAFPHNVNVAVALSLAGLGPDRTTIEIWADPAVERNTHTIRVDCDASRFTMTIEGVPSPENPATGLLTPLSVVAALRGLASPLRIGT